MSNTLANEHRLKIKRVFQASPEKVFDAWTQPSSLLKWFKGEKSWSIPIALVDFRVGGKYRIDMKLENGMVHPHFGKYIEINRPNRLVFTWSSEWSDGQTLVTLEFEKLGKETELTLTHEKFSTKEACDDHTTGWPMCLDRLGEYLEGAL